jgi:hypothetical protein
MKKERPCRFYMCVKAQTNSWARLCCHLAIYSEENDGLLHAREIIDLNLDADFGCAFRVRNR